jgi:hypothetical protein
MIDIDPPISKAIVKVLQQTGPAKPLGIRPLTTFANGNLRVGATADEVQAHVADLERKGYVERRANPFNAAVLEYAITAAGMTL